MLRSTVTVLFGATLLALAAVANAGTIVDTGPGTDAIGWTLSGTHSLIGVQDSHAAMFTLATPMTVNSLEAFMFINLKGDLDFNVYDAATGLPETSPALFHATLDTFNGCCDGGDAQWIGLTGLSLALDAGSYWFALMPPAGSTLWAGLNKSPAAPLADYAVRSFFDGPEWVSQYHTGVSYGVRITGVATVPEPASWGLMIAGFALTGSAIRRRRTVAG